MFDAIKRKIKSLLTPGYKKVLWQLIANRDESRMHYSKICEEFDAHREFLNETKSQYAEFHSELSIQNNEILQNQQEILKKLSSLNQENDALKQDIDKIFQHILVLDRSINTVFNYTYTVRDNLDVYYNRISDNLNNTINSTLNKSLKYSSLEYISSLLSDRSNKKILIAGFYGAYNLGDELMLQTLLSYVPEEMYKSITVLLYRSEDYIQTDLPPVNFLHYPSSFFEYDFLAKEFDILIWGGGALIDDTFYELRHTNLLGNMIIDLSDRFIAFNKKVVGVGLSTSEKFTNERYVEKLKELIPKFDSFSVRDKYSYKLLTDLGINNIIEIPDIVFSSDYFSEGTLSNKNDTVKCVGVTFVCLEETKDSFFKLVETVRSQYGKECIIKCIPFFNYDSNDIFFYKQWKEEIEDSENIIICEYKNTIKEICNEIVSADVMINMRYHAMVLTQMLGKPSLNICYDTSPHYHNKVLHLMEEFDTIQNMIHMCDFTDKKFSGLGSLSYPKPRHDLFETASKNIKSIIDKFMR